MAKVMRGYKPDMVLSVAGSNLWATLARFLLYRKTKIIISEHATLSVNIADVENSFTRWIYGHLVSFLHRRADLIVVPSIGVFNDLANNYHLPKTAMKIIPNPLDIRGIKKKSLENVGYPFLRNGIVIGFVGNLSKEKNVQALLRACSIIKERGISFHLVIVGEGSERKSLEELAKNLDLPAYFAGFQENQYKFMASFDAFVLPSLYEALPYAMLEAMVCGVPVVSSKWHGSEFVLKDGENSLLVPVNDYEKLSDAIVKVCGDEALRAKLVKNGFELARTCSTETVVKKYEDVITAVLAMEGKNG